MGGASRDRFGEGSERFITELCCNKVVVAGFALDQFNWGEGNDHLGNRVVFTSDTQTYDCPIHRDGTHGTQIVCVTE